MEINLSNEKTKIETPDENFYRRYIGGPGIGVRYIYSNQKAGVDPLGEESIIGFITGLFNGTVVPFGGRYTVVGKSPLTGAWGDANSGGFFGPELKMAGYDAVFIKGKAEKAVYLWIKDGEVEIRDASAIWGKDMIDTTNMIRSELGDNKITVAGIGPSGEKLSLISCVINDYGRAAARCGLGAVMGSKKLKAVAVRGSKRVQVNDSKKLVELRKGVVDPIQLAKPSRISKFLGVLLKPLLPMLLRRGSLPSPDRATLIEGYGKHGTTMLVAGSSEMGDSPVKNWKGVGYRDFPMGSSSSKISDDNIYKYVVRKYSCSSCPLGCGAIVKVKDGPYAVEEEHRPEYETCASFGMMLLNDNVESIIKANNICSRYGLDTISAGVTLSFAMECFENGLITKNDTGGIDLTWGNSEGIIQMLEKLAKREGFGDILADGVQKAAEKIGKGADKYAMHVGGEEVAMHDPRLNPSFGTTYVTDPSPGRHTQGGAIALEFGLNVALPIKGIEVPEVERRQYNGKGEFHKIMSGYLEMQNSLGICVMSGTVSDIPFLELIKATTGWDYSDQEFLECGERMQNLRQAFNVREGIKPSDFKLPDRIKGIPPQEKGPNAGVTIDLDMMVTEFYNAIGWDRKDGRPSREKLVNLGLDDVAQELYPKAVTPQ